MITAAVLWISAAPIIWLLAEQHSCTVRVIKCPGSNLLVDTLTRSITWLSRGALEVALKIYRYRYIDNIELPYFQNQCSHQSDVHIQTLEMKSNNEKIGFRNLTVWKPSVEETRRK